MLGHGTQYDQLNLPDLALGEAISRRLQLGEERYAEKLRASTAGGVSAGHATERHFFLGGSRAKGSGLVAKELETWVACQLAKEAVILKERRKGRENPELVAAASDPGTGTIESPSGLANVEWFLRHDQRHRPLSCFLYRQALARRKCG